ncbi:MAG TPA: tRNA 2-thiouridine(34) synthase MnmA, partial [Pseudomonadales bacterium]|nr:tRNA 2-thiouridine(34) synthase MnmA [Pseudomonadales bacterium]
EKIATGHYCRISHTHGKTQLLKGLDPNKDQSYFLHAVTEAALAKTLFPIGELEKPAVRALAEQHQLVTAKKKDSTGICFIGERRFKDFLERYLPAQPGDMKTVNGDIIGKHSGLMYYTIGQRQGLGIGGTKNGSEDPWYVADKDMQHNVLIVAQGDHPSLYASALECSQLHWINGEKPSSDTTLRCKIRYRQQDQACSITSLPHDRLRVDFDEAQRAITPGQSIVFYQDDVCLGGGIIEHAIDTEQVIEKDKA